MSNQPSSFTAPRFTTALAVETYKLRRSLSLLFAAVAPLPVVIFTFFNLMRLNKPMEWDTALKSSAGIWAFFMLPMSVTALTALMAQSEHGPSSWDYLRSLPIPRWHIYAAKAVCTIAVVIGMSVILVVATPIVVVLAGVLKPVVAATGTPDFQGFLLLVGRILLASLLMIGVQLWVALRQASFVPALALGICGTFFAVVATSAKAGIAMPWQMPVNQLASDPFRANITLALGAIGGIIALAIMLWRMSLRESPA